MERCRNRRSLSPLIGLMKVRERGSIPVLAALIVVVACGSGPSTVATTSITPRPSLATVFDDRFGFLINRLSVNDPAIGLRVRLESDPQPVFDLGIGDAWPIVSPDGRRLAYWSENELRVIEMVRSASPRTLLTTSGRESALYMAWSSDGTGLVVGVNGAQAVPAVDGPPAYTAVRVVDVAAGQPREIIRIANANVVPLAWDRKARLIAAYEPSSSGARSYYVVEEGGTAKRSDAGPGLYVVEASNDSQHVLGLGDPASVLRVWPATSYAAGIELRAVGGEPILAAGWRPGTAEIGVLFQDRLELWDASGGRRTLPLPQLQSHPQALNVHAKLRFRVDGKAAFVVRLIDGMPDTDSVAVDLSSGKTVVVAGGGALLEPGISVRVAST